MATRATYQFKTFGSDKPTVTLYNHHDGYPTGAVQHLEHALTPEAFIRKNPNAEIVHGHDACGDTEYRYTIERFGKRVTIMVHHRPIGENWTHLVYCSAETFRAKYWNDDHAEAFGNVRDRLAG